MLLRSNYCCNFFRARKICICIFKNLRKLGTIKRDIQEKNLTRQGQTWAPGIYQTRYLMDKLSSRQGFYQTRYILDKVLRDKVSTRQGTYQTKYIIDQVFTRKGIQTRCILDKVSYRQGIYQMRYLLDEVSTRRGIYQPRYLPVKGIYQTRVSFRQGLYQTRTLLDKVSIKQRLFKAMITLIDEVFLDKDSTCYKTIMGLLDQSSTINF